MKIILNIKKKKDKTKIVSIYLPKYSFSCVVDLAIHTDRHSICILFFSIHFHRDQTLVNHYICTQICYMFVSFIPFFLLPFSRSSPTYFCISSFTFVCYCRGVQNGFFLFYFFYSFEIQFLISPSFKHFIHICNDTKRINVCHLGTLFQIKCELVMPHS